MSKLTLFIIFIIYSCSSLAQKKYVNDIGINMAGIAIINDELVAPSLIYKHTFNNIQARIQLAFDVVSSDVQQQILVSITQDRVAYNMTIKMTNQ